MIRAGDTFTWRGVDLPYLVHPYNDTALNERAWEVPLAQWWMTGGDGLEVGNVTGHYFRGDHRVVDLYEEADGVENLDVFDIAGEYDWVLAISTLEHVRWDPPEERDPFGALAACDHLRGLLRPGGRMLATVPFGQNPPLDSAIVDGDLRADREATMAWSSNGWAVLDGCARPGPLRERRWPTCVWVGEWYT